MPGAAGDDATSYRLLVESVADPMYWLAPDGTVEMVNDAMVEFVGVPREELVGAPATAFLPEEDVAVVEELIADLLDDGDGRARHEFTLRRPDGEERWVEANLAPVVEGGEFRGSVGVVRDVTERRRREQRLAEFETIVETAPIGMCTLDEEAVVTWANDVYAETLGVAREDLVGTVFTDLIAEGYYEESVVDQYIDTVRELLSSGNDRERASYVVETHLPDETLVHEVYTALLPLEDGEFRGTVSAFRDITTQRRYERRLRRQNERLDEFTSVVSHDLRNPLAIAEGYVEQAMETGEVDGLERAAAAHERMRELIDDLLSLARKGRTVRAPEPVDLASVARAAWESTGTAGATLELDAPGRVLADAERLRELFENLFRNSVEHGSPAPDGGRGGESTLTVTVGSLPDGFYVADDGVGLPATDRDRLFEHGYTDSVDGTGLGLAIVAGIAEAHGWSIAAAESDDGGARFEMREVESA